MFKIINKETHETLATGLPSTNLDEAIRLSGGTIDQHIEYDANVKLNGKAYFYDHLTLVPEDWKF